MQEQWLDTNSTALLGKATHILKFLEPKTLSYCLKKKKLSVAEITNVGVSRDSLCVNKNVGKNRKLSI